ncbi:MAG TPA: aminotransferase class I/II-fold pyridoxal phosphate-dependent enzyme [Candidatus Gastranaerophilaceae bacterium]|nr:aminotransferase class I/II-fold pyridoxal phosphate-dependent enzyme [Candidatus Gastranaerophilaceae bacterium]
MKKFFNDYIQTLETYIMFKISEEVARIKPDLISKGRSPIALSLGAPVDNPPQFVIDKLKDALDVEGIHSYSSPKGEAFYLEAVAKRMKERFGVDLESKTEVFSLIGSKEGLANFIRALITAKKDEFERDIILIPDPGYASYKEMIKVSGGVGYSIPLTYENNYMPDMEEVLAQLKKEGYDEKKIKALVINYPNNPLGATATLDYFKKLVEFCKKHNILLISDAAYTDMYFDENDRPHSVLELEGAKDIAVEFFSFSKPYAMTGWRLGWVCGNSEAVSIFGKLKTTIDTGIFKALQKAASEVLNSKEGEEYIKKANAGFKKKQDIFIKGLSELGWDIDNINIPNATFYLWLPIPPRYKTSKEFTDDLMRTSGIIAVPGDGFGKYGEGFFRISIVCSDENIYEVIDRMKKDGFYFNN